MIGRLPRLLLVGGLAAALAACPGSDPVADAGTDGGWVEEDAGRDAGTEVLPDAGALPDAGLPPVLELHKVLPSRAPTTGGIHAAFVGTGFVRGVALKATDAKKRTTIRFGSNVVQDFQIIDDEMIDVRVPPGSPGPVEVTIENDNGLFTCPSCFTYFEEVLLKSASPAEGPLRGGTEVTLTGAGFTDGVQVLFGGQSVPGLTLSSSTELRVIAPRAVEAGLVDLTVYSKNGVGTLRRVFHYHPDLRIDTVAPLTGPLSGGTQVAVEGVGFAGATAVLFGGVPAAAFAVKSDTRLTATAPPSSSAGAVEVTVQTPRDSGTVRGGFTYVLGAGFALYGVFPHLGPIEGGNEVTLTGEGLDAPGLTVQVGGAAVPVTFAGPHQATVVMPPRAADRRVDVEVSDGAQALVLPQGYTYRMQLTSSTPARGPAAGGTSIRLLGEGFPPDAQVYVGARQGQVQTVTDGTVELLAPPGQGGAPTAIRVREAADPQNEAVLQGAFTFDEALAVGRVQPERGAIAGGTWVTVLGAGFGEGTLVRFGGQVAKDIKVLDPHTLNCRTPKAEGVGPVEVKVERQGQVDVLSGGFSYFDPRSISGGLSGGPLTGTLNVTVLESTQGFYGTPVPLAQVVLGVDPGSPFQGQTDARGQLTFSDASLVKALVVTVFKDGFETATVTSVNAENLTVFIARIGGGGPPPDPVSVSPSVISGRIKGFKNPRPLGPNESLEARVFVAQPVLLLGVPFFGLPNRQFQIWQVTKDGGEYRLHTSAGLRATYAILGVVNKQLQTFEPYLMGMRRGITVNPDNPASGQDIVLDMHLDQTVPVTVDQPLQVDGAPALNTLYAWLDLGAEGVIPNPHNWDAGLATTSSVSSTEATLSFPGFPRLDGSNFVFMNFCSGPGGLPRSIFYRRQPGDLSLGLTIGPMLPMPRFTHPVPGQLWNGTLSWEVDAGPVPDLHRVRILRDDGVTLWSLVLPGVEKQVTLPPLALQKLRDEAEGGMFFLQLDSSRLPKFAYNQWTYDSLSWVNWSSYTIAFSYFAP